MYVIQCKHIMSKNMKLLVAGHGKILDSPNPILLMLINMCIIF